MKNKLLLILFVLCGKSIFAQTALVTLTGNVYNDPDGGSINASAVPFSLPLEKLRVVLIETAGNTITHSVEVNQIDGSFLLQAAPGSYYAMLMTPSTSILAGLPAPASRLTSGWVYIGESLQEDGTPDAIIDGRTETITLTTNSVHHLIFGIQERPFAFSKMNDLLNNTSLSPIPLSVNVSSDFTIGGSAILEGSDYSGGTIVSYTINVLPKYGTLYLESEPVTSLIDVASLTPLQLSSLAYLPDTLALAQEQDFFTYYVTDNALTQSSNAAYVIPFPLLESDNDTYANRNDLDDDNDGITDANECSLNDFSTLAAAFSANEFTLIVPSMLGYADIEHRSGLNITADISSSFGYPANSGAIIVTASNANTHPSADHFYINDSTGPTQWTVSGTVGAYAVLEHGQQYFSYDTRTITLLNATPKHFIVAQQPIDPPADSWWILGSDAHSWWITSNTALRMSEIDPTEINPRLGSLTIALIDPEPKYFQFSSTANNQSEWATYFVRLLPECDYDMDGVPNRLDLDSDNDNCLDALEGSRAFEYVNINNAGGTVWVGAGSSAANRNLCDSVGCVDANGIPITVTGGQAPVETYNEVEVAAVCNVPMSITLSEFNAFKVRNSVLLKWVMVPEDNNEGFEIEHSADGNNWIKIGFIKSRSEDGNSAAKLEYAFTHNTPVINKNMYRLKQTYFDGKYEYSSVRMINFSKESKSTIYPNPAKDNINITGLQGNENIKIYDVTGRLVLHTTAVDETKIIKINDLNDGVYYIQIKEDYGVISSHKMIKSN